MLIISYKRYCSKTKLDGSVLSNEVAIEGYDLKRRWSCFFHQTLCRSQS